MYYGLGDAYDDALTSYKASLPMGATPPPQWWDLLPYLRGEKTITSAGAASGTGGFRPPESVDQTQVTGPESGGFRVPEATYTESYPMAGVQAAAGQYYLDAQTAQDAKTNAFAAMLEADKARAAKDYAARLIPTPFGTLPVALTE